MLIKLLLLFILVNLLYELTYFLLPKPNLTEQYYTEMTDDQLVPLRLMLVVIFAALLCAACVIISHLIPFINTRV